MATRLRSMIVLVGCAASQMLAGTADQTPQPSQASVGGMDIAAFCFFAAGAGLIVLRRTHRRRRSQD